MPYPLTKYCTKYLTKLGSGYHFPYSAGRLPQFSLRHTFKSDPEVYSIILEEQTRQKECLELIASENFPPPSVLQPLSSVLVNKYSEGQPNARYYSGNKNIDKLELLCQSRALDLYDLDETAWGVNVQALSGTPANMAVYTALLTPGTGRIMGLSLSSGGHLSHGHKICMKDGGVKPISGASIYFDTEGYDVDPDTGMIDYGDVERRAKAFKPHILVCGGSAYPRHIDYARMRSIADSISTADHQCLLLTDMSHISGLIAANCSDSPFPYSDVVTSTTHKTLRGPRSGLIFSRRRLKERIDRGVFPGMQGGPHNNQIGGVAVALKLAKTDNFKEYGEQVVANAKALGVELVRRGFTLSSGGTDNHLLLIDIRTSGLTGAKVQEVLELCGLTTNKNSLPSDTSAVNPGGVRVGTAALTSRGMKETEMVKVAGWIQKGVDIGKRIQDGIRDRKRETDGGGEKGTNKVTFKDFALECEQDKDVETVREEVKQFARKWYLPEV